MLKVIKIGGNVIDNPAKLDEFLTGFARLEEPKILVHGGGKKATEVSKSLGIETLMINGRRVTDRQTLDVVVMVYGGLINKSIVSKLNGAGCPAIGLTGPDGDFIVARRRDPKPVDYGFVGDPEKVNTDLARAILNQGYTIVTPALSTDGGGEILNTNADTIASTLAIAMAAGEPTELVFCFEKAGVLRDVEDEGSLIPQIDPASFERLKAEGVVADGMLPKLENAFAAIGSGVARVVICSAENIAREGYGGTSVTK